MTKTNADLERREAELISKSLRELSNGEEKDSIDKIRLTCLSHGNTGIIRLSKAFRVIDHEGDYAIDLEEFTNGLKNFGIHCSNQEIEKLFKRFDVDGNGYLYMTEFLLAVRPSMSPRRYSIIERAFEKMDKDGDGVITIQDMRNVYSVHDNPQYITGDKTEEEILQDFLDNFEVERGNRKEKVTQEEFLNYYSSVSAAIEQDIYFDLIIRQSFDI